MSGTKFATASLEDLEDSDDATVSGVSGLVVSSDNTLYATADDGIWRLLLHESGNLWEVQDFDEDITAPDRLWLGSGSNILLTTDANAAAGEAMLYWWIDRLTGQVTLSSPADDAFLGETDEADLAWVKMTDAKKYEYKYDKTSDTTKKTSATIEDLDAATEYDWKVRVTSPFQSRWSDEWTFTTELATTTTPLPMLAPAPGAQNVPVLQVPFQWGVVESATSYELELSTNPEFAALVETTVETTVAYYAWATALAYDTAYYWRVRAITAAGNVGDWVASVFSTETEPAELDITLEQPDITLTSPSVNVDVDIPAAETPAYVWAIVAIGAILTIAVIVLIVRTRRVV